MKKFQLKRCYPHNRNVFPEVDYTWFWIRSSEHILHGTLFKFITTEILFNIWHINSVEWSSKFSFIRKFPNIINHFFLQFLMWNNASLVENSVRRFTFYAFSCTFIFFSLFIKYLEERDILDLINFTLKIEISHHHL